MRNNVKLLALLTALFLLPISLAAQGVGLNQNQAGAAGSLSTGDEMSERMYHAQTQKSIAGRIYSSKGGVVAKAGVEITNNAGAAAQYVVTDKEGDFQAGFNLFDEAMGKHFVASLKVTRKGFLPAYKIVVMDASTTNISFAINLRPEGPEDPYWLPQSELLKGLTPRLRQLGPSDGMAARSKKIMPAACRIFLTVRACGPGRDGPRQCGRAQSLVSEVPHHAGLGGVKLGGIGTIRPAGI